MAKKNETKTVLDIEILPIVEDVLDGEKVKYVEIEDKKYFIKSKLESKKTTELLQHIVFDNKDSFLELQQQFKKGISIPDLLITLLGYSELFHSTLALYFETDKKEFEEMDIVLMIRLAITLGFAHMGFFMIAKALLSKIMG